MLSESTRQLANGPNFAVLTTRMPDGHAQTHVMWVGHDDEHLLINTELHRQKAKNVTRDPRVTVTIIDRNDPYSFVEIRGTVVDTVTGAPARRHIDDLSLKYNGRPYPSDRIHSERVILKVRPDREFVRTR